MRLGKKIKDELDSPAYFLVGIEDDLACGIVDEPDRKTKAQSVLLCFSYCAAYEPLTEPMKFCLRHGAIKTEKKTVIILAGIIDAFFVDDQSIGQGADFKQVIPVATRAGQA